jgi:hypothetical protein
MRRRRTRSICRTRQQQQAGSAAHVALAGTTELSEISNATLRDLLERNRAEAGRDVASAR